MTKATEHVKYDNHKKEEKKNYSTCGGTSWSDKE